MIESELLFTRVFNCSRLSLYRNKDLLVERDKASLLAAALKRRMLGEPIQYILGNSEFMGLEFKVTPAVLIPRPETEILVETVINICSKGGPLSCASILDLGTGSGNIAVSLAKFLPQAKIYATDISSQALEMAKENALLNKVEERITFLESDLFGAIRDLSFDICVSNPPYVRSRGIDSLQPEIRYEPRLALDGGKDGLEFYRKLVDLAPRYLKKDGFLVMEMGFGQGKKIKKLFQGSPCLELKEVIRDYNNIERLIIGKRYG